MMKKTNRLFFTMCLAAGLACVMGSCKKNEEVASVTIDVPGYEEEVEGRAYIDINDGCKFKWNANDQVAIYNLGLQGGSEKAIYQAGANAQGQTVTRFTYASGDQLSAKKYGYFVFYPVDKVNDDVLDERNYQTFNVPAEQTYTTTPSGVATVDPKGMAMACDLSSLTGTFTLKHIFGVLKLRLTGTGTVTKIEVEDAKFGLNGTVGMKLHEVNMNTFTSLQNMYINSQDPFENDNFVSAWDEYRTTLGYTAQSGSNVMTLNCPNGVQLSQNAETPFYIGLRPGALKYGFTLKIYRAGQDEPTTVVYTAQAFNYYGIKAGVIKNLVYTIY